MSQTTSISPEQDQKLIEKFNLSAEPTLRKLLNTIEDDEHEIYVHLHTNKTQFVTEVLCINWDEGLIWLGTPYNKTLSAGCNEFIPYTMVSFPDGVKVQFSGIGILQSQYQGADALRISIPKSIARLQRRNYFRVVADDELNAQAKLDIPSVQGNPTLVDLSLAGCGFLVQAKPDQYNKGEVLKNVRLSLQDNSNSMLIELVVRNIKQMTEQPETIQLGCEMKVQDKTGDRRLQRFLLATERRQRASLHSID